MCVSGGNSNGNTNWTAHYAAAAPTSLSVLSVQAASGTYGGTVTLEATLSSGATGLSSKTISFSLNGSSVGTATTNAGGVASIDVQLTSDGTAAGTLIGAGTYSAGPSSGVGVSFVGDASYAAASGTANLTVGKATPSVAATGGPFEYTGGPHDGSCEATGVGGADLGPLTPTYTPGPGVPVNAGTYTVNCSYVASANYTSASASADLTIDKATPTVEATGGAFDYTGTAHTGTCAVTGVGGADIGPLAATYTPGPDAPAHAGSYTVNCWYATSTNYEAASDTAALTIAQVALTLDVSAADATYTGLAYAGASTCAASGVNGEQPLTARVFKQGSIALGGAPTNAGSYTLECTAGGSGTDYLANAASAPFTIHRAPLSIHVSAPDATYTGLAYAGTVTCTADGVNGEHPTTTQTFKKGSQTLPGRPTNAGTYTLECTAGGTDTNYLANSSSVSFTIQQATLTIHVSAEDAIYSGAPYAAATTCTADGVNGEHPLTTRTFKSGSETLPDAPTHAGTYAVECAGGGPGTNYVANVASAPFTIGKRPIRVAAVSATKTYGDPDPALNFVVSGNGGGLVGADTAATVFSGELSRTAGVNVGTYAITRGTLALVEPSDYTLLNFNDGALTITPATLSIAASAAVAVYTGFPYAGAIVCTATGVLGETPVTTATFIQGTTALPASPTNAGAYALLCAAGGLGTNYFANSASADFSITPAPLTVAATSYSIIFGQPAPTFGVSYTGLLGSDTPAHLAGSLVFNFAGVPPTSYGPTTIVPTSVGTYVVRPSGLVSANYQITYVPGRFTVTAWHLTGFYQPVGVENTVVGPPPVIAPVWNAIKGGSTVPLKFNIYASIAGTELTSVSDAQGAGYGFSLAEVPCTAAYEEAVEVFQTTGGTTLRYDALAGQFIQNWQSPKGGGRCFRTTLRTRDGSQLSAFFKTK